MFGDKYNLFYERVIIPLKILLGKVVHFMKKIKALAALLFIAFVLTGCDMDTSVVSGTDDSSEISAVSSTYSTETVSVSLPAESTPNSAEETLTQAEFDEIISLFSKWAYVGCDIHPDRTRSIEPYFPLCVDRFNYITEERLQHKGGVMTYTEYYYKVVSGACATEEGFNAKLNEIFTEKYKEKYLGSSEGQKFRIKDGDVYVAPVNYLSLEPRTHNLKFCVERPDADTIVLTIKQSDTDSGFKQTIVKTKDGSHRIDDGNLFSIQDFFCFSRELNVTCGDLTYSRPSTWNTSVTSEITELWDITEFECAMALLKDLEYVDYELHIPELKFCTDPEQSIYESWTDDPFNKVVNSPLSEAEAFLRKLDIMFTKSYKQRYISNPDRRFTFKEGIVYTAPPETDNSLIINVKRFELTSFDRIDENTILMTLSCKCNIKDYDNNEENPTYECTIRLVKDEDWYHFRIDDIISSFPPFMGISECFWVASTLYYGDISIRI